MMIEEVKTHFSIPELGKELFPDWQPAKSCRSPFRDDRVPSFSVYRDGTLFMDFATGQRGDQIDFYALARGLSTAEALLELWNRLQAGAGYVARPLKAHFHDKLDLDVRRPTRDDPFALPYTPSRAEHIRMKDDSERLLKNPAAISAIAAARSWPEEILKELAFEGALGLSAASCITFNFLSGSKSRWLEPNGKRAFRWNFGKPWFWRGEALLGAPALWIVEGETKAITALCWGWEKTRRVVAIPSASFDPAPWAYLFRDKEVFYLADSDRAGMAAAGRIKAALGAVASSLSVLTPEDLRGP
jgi:CHC2-type zinc finger protein